MLLPRALAIKGIVPSKTTVYSFKNSEYDSSAPAHLHIVIPINDSDYVLLTMITSQVEKRKGYYAHNPKALASVIDIEKDDLDLIRKESVIDCNKPLYQTREELATIISGDIEYIDVSIPDELIDRIKVGIVNSPLVKPIIKKSIEI